MTANVLLFGKHHSDHIASVKWDENKGWNHPVIKPFEGLRLTLSARLYITDCNASKGSRHTRTSKEKSDSSDLSAMLSDWRDLLREYLFLTLTERSLLGWWKSTLKYSSDGFPLFLNSVSTFVLFTSQHSRLWASESQLSQNCSSWAAQ